MPFANRQFCLALLLILLVSHVAVAAHAATHSPGELGQCELCISYGASTSAVAADDDQFLPLLGGSDPIQCSDIAVHSATILVAHPRGPPVDS
jgi:hypothetical protein